MNLRQIEIKKNNNNKPVGKYLSQITFKSLTYLCTDVSPCFASIIFFQESYKYDSSSTSVGQSNYNQGAETYTYTYPTGMAEHTQNQPQETDIDLEKVMNVVKT